MALTTTTFISSTPVRPAVDGLKTATSHRCPSNRGGKRLRVTSTLDVPRTARECAQNFLTQRAVQQTIFCAFILRDETSARWLEAFSNPRRKGDDENLSMSLYDLHACNALQYPSEEYLKRLFEAPVEKLIIKKPIQGRTNNKNPYIKRRYFTYDVDVVPRNLAKRVLQARAQIAEELTEDLSCIPADNERLTEQFRRLTLTKDSQKEHDLPTIVERGGSPYRKATFDLVCNYTLYLSLDAVVRRANKTSDIRWLNDVKKTYDHQLLLPQNGQQGLCDVVLHHMFTQVPAVNAYGTFFDPVGLTHKVLEERESTAETWRQYMTSVREEHDTLQQQFEP